MGVMDLVHGIVTGTYTLETLIQWGGYFLLVAIVFTETGLLVGFFLPGDSLLITAGLLAGMGTLNIWWLNGLVMAAAILGDSTGYAIGARLGPRIFTKEKSVLAGVGNMRYRRFLIYNMAGGIGWVASMSWAGYLLGQTVPNISKHIHVLVIVVIVLSVIPIAVEVYRERRKAPTRS